MRIANQAFGSIGCESAQFVNALLVECCPTSAIVDLALILRLRIDAYNRKIAHIVSQNKVIAIVCASGVVPLRQLASRFVVEEC